MTEWIAEISSNHNGDLMRVLHMVDAAASSGATAIKLQLFRVHQLFAPEALRAKPELLKRMAWELPVDMIKPIADACHAQGLKFGCTPFYMDAIDILEPYVDFYKIASYQIPWLNLIYEVARKGKHIIMSVGMADALEIREAVNCICDIDCGDPILLHCVSSYPAKPDECNLNSIDYLRRKFGMGIGWSDHSVNPFVIYNAVAVHHAEVVEFHFDLDGTGDEYHLGHCWLPHTIRPVIEAANLYQAVNGQLGIMLPDSAVDERAWRSDPSDGKRPMMAIRKELSPE